MTMISYAQNFEDVMLNRIFRDIKQGFYIDVGANDPIIDSVTKHFYDNGWTGINIEPVAEHFQALQMQRPNDINLQIAISLEEGKLEFWESEVRGWSTASPESIALHEKQNEKGIIKKVESSTLTKICEQYAKDDIHFLKVDVEGFEKSVIESNDWSRFRPWVVVVEATLPNSQIESFAEWETILLEADYQFAYADGLNRFYLAKEHSNLFERLKYPPNVFDQFSMYSLHVKNKKNEELSAKLILSQQKCEELCAKLVASQQKFEDVTVLFKRDMVNIKYQLMMNQAELVKAQSELGRIHRKNHLAHLLVQELSTHIHNLENSRSWKITQPLRKLKAILTGKSPNR